MNARRVGLSFALALVAFATSAGSVDDEVKALRAVISSNSVNRTVGCRYYRAWFRELCTKAEREAILESNVAAHRRLIELLPGNVAVRADLGMVLALGGRYKEAESVLKEAISAGEAKDGMLDQTRMSEARWSLAECLWRKGDREDVKKLVADIVNMPWTGGFHRSSAHDKATFLHWMWTDPDADIDYLTLPHHLDCKPFPVPQEAKYGEKKVSLARVELKVKGLGEAKNADPIVRLLKRKLTRFGTKFEKGGTPIEIELSPDAPVDKPQGYSLDVAKSRIAARARTRLGLTYSVVSLLQCIDREKLAIAECEIRDWPKLEKRGVIAHWDPCHMEYELFNKMSSVAMDMFRPQWSFLTSPLEREVARLSIKRRNDFGIDLRWANRWIIVDPNLPLSSPRVRAMHLAWMRCAASYGAGVWFDEDDSRYPLRPEDKEAFGSADKLDAKYLDGLYKEVKAEYPGFRLTFGPPFYFGPDAPLNKIVYPEPRDPYLRSVGEFLDPEVDVYWSGPRVKTWGLWPVKIKWFSDMVKRKQVIYHNADCRGAHNFYRYGIDVPGFKEKHSPEALDMIGGFYMNTSRYSEACSTGPAMEWCWNPDAHESKTATRRTVDQLEGAGVFDILTAAMPSVAYFDRYACGTPRSELFMEDQADLDGKIATAEKAWEDAKPLMKNGGKFVYDYNALGIGWAKKLAKYLRNPPKWLLEKRDAELKNTKFAVEEVGYDASKGDVFIPSELMSGGEYFFGQGDYSGRGKRGIKYLNHGRYDSVSMKFDVEVFPPVEPPKFILVGMSFKPDFQPDMEIELNGKVVWRGKAFKAHWFTPLEIDLPVYALQRSNNTIVVRNTAPAEEHQRKPIVHYAVIRMEKR